MPRKEVKASNPDCPGINIHVIDIAQPPGIGISAIADMDIHHTMVVIKLAVNSSAITPKNV
jgi:hypothetical protein